ncbi:expressed unknown protein [Seminavis robusta]|uniref:Uncharacterized protein n=1 Tax=Seminavis robusta TaxID=568900 RepID=A0A9N8E2Q4_9STRA|nr:expressed unknown protein [Seminavis robusta]|eukprot:Sro557_g166110.1 n/a (184) ;mRNA; r:22899-23450
MNMTSTTASEPKEDVGKPPGPADANVVGSIAQQGIIGQCLRDALQDVMDQQEGTVDGDVVGAEEQDDDDNSDDNPSNNKKIKLGEHMVDGIMQRFGQAVAESSSHDAPPALLRGRMDHYNRFNDKWRIIVKDVTLKRRVALPVDRKKKARTSLWEKVGEQETVRMEAAAASSSSLQLLAYDDL